MSWMFIILIVIVLVILVVVKQLPKNESYNSEYQYQQIGKLFTPAEISFLGALKLAVNDELEIYGKVRVADILKPQRNKNRSIWQKSFNKISAKHFDFILCQKNTMKPICAIELNDKSHKNKKRAERDAFLASACESASFPLISIAAQAAYKVPEIKEELSAFLQSSTRSPTALEQSDEKLCPKCSSLMALKVAKKGKNIGKQFWACFAFPKCRHIEAAHA